MITFDDMVECHESRKTMTIFEDITEDTTSAKRGNGKGTSVATSSNKVKLVVKAYNTRATKKRKAAKAVKQLM